jgi:hypothetical protein
MSGISRHLRPTDREILELARRETDAREVERFEPICRGPLLAAVAILAVLLAALPACLLRLIRGSIARDAGGAR